MIEAGRTATGEPRDPADRPVGWATEPAMNARDATLQARARQLARERAVEDPGDQLQLLVFRLASESFAFETRFVREVYPLKDLTPIPCTPPFLLGVINLRGEICPVMELKRLFGLPGQGLTNVTRAIILQIEAAELGVVADAIAGVRQVSSRAIVAAPETLSRLDEGFLRGMTEDRVAILDAARLLAYRRIVVDEQVER
jgi:purine-binding chemotaxis protein CheW